MCTLTLLAALAVSGVAAPLKTNLVGGETRQGMAAGQSGEYFRYKHLYEKKPTEADFENAQKVAGEIRCPVCKAIVESLMKKAKSFSEDDLADVLEGNADYVPTGDRVTDQMNKHRKGCNKHFKDELVAVGYMLRQCKDVAPDFKNDSSPCLWKNADPPSQHSVDTYEVWKEGLFYACEQSVGRHTDELAEALAEKLPGTDLSDASCAKLADELCHSIARCESIEKPRKSQKKGTIKNKEL
eukprot:TRINITY_DN41485_c0_g1_i1.p1 TRINITY_DN41485_c0_g1~~TRINITY_DN41485_c0_g1_i1.p1  ORF type:complete len:241 (-),score=58.51 TRINITY_DN41485_c0_g1_i1:294-1016(-)